jgi:hypothetical protein
VAIKTYLDYGFVPDMDWGDLAEAVRAWRLVRDHLHHPALDGIAP